MNIARMAPVAPVAIAKDLVLVIFSFYRSSRRVASDAPIYRGDLAPIAGTIQFS